MQVKHQPLYYDQNGKLHYDGSNYPDNCCYCGAVLEGKCTALQDTNLIFCNDNCLVEMVDKKTVDVQVTRKGGVKCIVS